jgi:hypothetical protein
MIVSKSIAEIVNAPNPPAPDIGGFGQKFSNYDKISNHPLEVQATERVNHRNQKPT